jgi:hypothetical protein
VFGYSIPPTVEQVRVIALTGKKGKPPCLWEGPPATEQATIDEQIACNTRIVRWMSKNKLIKGGCATLPIQLDLYSQGKKVESVNVPAATILVAKKKKKKKIGDEVAVRAFDMTEGMVELMRELLEERETVIGRLVERGMNPKKEPPVVVEETKQDLFSQFLEKGVQFANLAKVFRELKDGK